MLVLAVTGLALTAVLVVLVRRRRAEAARAATEGTPDLARTLSAHFQAPPAPPADPAPEAAPAAPLVEAESEVEVPAPPGAATGVWAQRRSPYASGRPDPDRIALPDDDADPEIPWRTEEGSIAHVRGTTPLARTAQVTSTGRIGVSDDAGAVTWRPPSDRP